VPRTFFKKPTNTYSAAGRLALPPGLRSGR
jgi:hypothetical protein